LTDILPEPAVATLTELRDDCPVEPIRIAAAHALFASLGADAFTERTRHELLATGEKVRKREVDRYNQLTAQEEHIARLARDGRTNPEIGAELFISTRTVEWHLRKVFAKLGITSRRELHKVVPQQGQPTRDLTQVPVGRPVSGTGSRSRRKI